jgi:hypothetical protein
MHVLFMMKHPGVIRNFESTLRELLGRGHAVTLSFDTMTGGAANALLARLEGEFSGLRHERLPKTPMNPWTPLVSRLRLAIDYLRYLQPPYAGATKLRARAEGVAPPLARRVAAHPALRGPRRLRLLQRALQSAERALPTPPEIDAFVAGKAPDVVLVSPLVGLGSRQADYVRSARRAGLATGLCALSWDNLTNKGLLRDVPDLVAVWNEAQAREARDLHGVPADRVAVTGAVAYDHWFAWGPSRAREAFCAEVGLPAGRPFVLYVCSSPFIAPDEVAFVRRWLAAIRGADDPEVAGLGVLVRPHPQNAEQWRDARLGDERAVVWPGEGADPVDDRARNDYFDSIHHAAAVVGLNTSALIESAVVGRRVLTVLDPEFRPTQEGTLHFHHLAGAMLTVARDLDEHVAQLARAGEADPGHVARTRRFLESFVRPGGLATDAAPGLVDAIEAAARRGPREPAERPLRDRAWRFALAPVARRVHADETARRAERKAASARARKAVQDAAAASSTWAARREDVRGPDPALVERVARRRAATATVLERPER